MSNFNNYQRNYRHWYNHDQDQDHHQQRGVYRGSHHSSRYDPRNSNYYRPRDNQNYNDDLRNNRFDHNRPRNYGNHYNDSRSDMPNYRPRNYQNHTDNQMNKHRHCSPATEPSASSSSYHSKITSQNVAFQEPPLQGTTCQSQFIDSADISNAKNDLSDVVIFFKCNKNGTYVRDLYSIINDSIKISTGTELSEEKSSTFKDGRQMHICKLIYNGEKLIEGEGVSGNEAQSNAAFLLINKLATTNYTVKAKADYFALDFSGKFQTTSGLKDIYSLAEKGLTAVNSLLHIEAALRDSKTTEVIFEKDDCSSTVLCAINKFVGKHDDLYTLRFASESNIGVSANLTPQYIRDNLLASGPLTAKYDLIPPLGEGKNLLQDVVCSGFLPHPKDESNIEVNIIPKMTKAKGRMMTKRLVRHHLADAALKAGRKLTRKEKTALRKQYFGLE